MANTALGAEKEKAIIFISDAHDCEVCGSPHKVFLCHLSPGLFRILRGMPVPIYGQFRPLIGILRLNFLSCVLVLNRAVRFSF